MAISQNSAYALFYEKALFVKGDVATAPGLRQLLCPSRYASIRTFGELSLVARCIMGSVFIRALLRRCNLPSGLPLGGWAKFAWRTHLVRSEALSRAKSRGHPPLFRVATLPVVFTSSVFVCSIASLPKLPPPALGADWRCRAARRPPR